jgi:L-ascorbate metabolism protein UlaG (beta-lactamase superfamily)
MPPSAGPHYLRTSVLAQPVVHHWYALPQLLAPATSAMNMANRYLRLMRSFLRAPAIHVKGSQAQLGSGRFLDVDPSRAGEIQALVDDTVRRLAPQLELAQAVAELDELLLAAGGESLEPLYARVPVALRGLVELVYDRSDRASARLLEPLLYRSRYYDPALQAIHLSSQDHDRRPFVLSAPLQIDAATIAVARPFADPVWDELFRTRSAPGDPGALAEQLGIAPSARPRFGDLFTSDAPPRTEAFSDEGVRMRHFGHACVLLESRRASVLVDPLVMTRADPDVARFVASDLPPVIDTVLITHGHADHLSLETLLQLRHRVRRVVVPRCEGRTLEDFSLRRLVRALGFPVVEEPDLGEPVRFDGGELVGLPVLGEHADLDISAKRAWLIKLEGRSFVLAADAANLEPALLRHALWKVGPIDALFLGLECDGAPLSWLYGPLFTRPIAPGFDQSRRLAGSDFAGALDLTRQLGARRLFIYAMGLEPWLAFLIGQTAGENALAHARRLIAACREHGVEAEILHARRELRW